MDFLTLTDRYITATCDEKSLARPVIVSHVCCFDADAHPYSEYNKIEIKNRIMHAHRRNVTSVCKEMFVVAQRIKNCNCVL